MLETHAPRLNWGGAQRRRGGLFFLDGGVLPPSIHDLWRCFRVVVVIRCGAVRQTSLGYMTFVTFSNSHFSSPWVFVLRAVLPLCRKSSDPRPNITFPLQCIPSFFIARRGQQSHTSGALVDKHSLKWKVRDAGKSVCFQRFLVLLRR